MEYAVRFEYIETAEISGYRYLFAGTQNPCAGNGASARYVYNGLTTDGRWFVNLTYPVTVKRRSAISRVTGTIRTHATGTSQTLPLTWKPFLKVSWTHRQAAWTASSRHWSLTNRSAMYSHLRILLIK